MVAVTFGARVAELAARHPDRLAVVFVAPDGTERPVPWSELDRRGNQVARFLEARGVDSRSLLVVNLPSCVEHLLAAIAGWRLGACVLPLNPRMPEAEQRGLLSLAEAWRPATVISDTAGPGSVAAINRSSLAEADDLDASALPDRTAQPGKAMASGGSTGRPKIIVDPSPWLKTPGAGILVEGAGFREGQTQLITGPLHHNVGLSLWSNGLAEDQLLIIMERFNATLAVDLIERHRVSYLGMVPTVMQRILQLPAVRSRDFSSIEAFYHTGGPCPEWVKRGWLELVPPERHFELFGSTENNGMVIIRGDEWLRRPGSVGRGVNCVVAVRDDAGQDVEPGVVGEIFMGRPGGPATHAYIGAPPPRTAADGLTSVGDLGWMDADGYLYVADRRADLIISGGANVYPAEVEAALSEHGQVVDTVVVGLPDANWGKRVHAVIQPADINDPPSKEELDRFCRQRLSPYKIPKSYAYVAELPRDEAGKVRRGAIAAAFS